MIKEFHINIDDTQIDLLNKKIELTRWPDEINNEYWSHGTSMSFLKELSEYWINDFNWKCKYFFSIILNLEKMIFFHFGQVLLFWGLSLVLVF